MIKWEHKVIEAVNHNKLAAMANDAGALGWELVDVYEVSGFVIGFMKRPAVSGTLALLGAD